jgi:hypothetical protein
MNNASIWTRRSFLAGWAAVSATGALPPSAAPAQAQAASPITAITGNGEWTYRAVPNWGALAAGTSYGGTHGAIATGAAGNIYVATQSSTGVLVYSPDGTLQRRILTDYPEVHSMVHQQDVTGELFHVTVQKGTPEANWLYLAVKPDGTVVRKITAPPEAGFAAPNAWRLTAAIPAPDGDLWIANGYGDSRLFRFDKNGNYKAAYAGKGSADGMFQCSHGLAVDTRYDQPLLLVCDRENRRLVHLDFDGRFVRTIAMHMRRPCQVSFHGEHAVVSELEGRVTILDKDNAIVAFLGDNPDRTVWAKYDLNPALVAPALFSAAHGCLIDAQGNIYISDWNKTGRVSKFVRLNA